MTGTTTLTEQVEMAGFRAMMADSDRDEHLLMSAFTARWAPHIECDYATDGAQLLLKLALINRIDDLPSVLIINRYMAKYDGLRTLCELQAHPILWQIPVMVVVDNDDVRAEIDCYRSGARWVQTKPKTIYDFYEFIVRIEAVAAPRHSYEPCGALDLSAFNSEYASFIEDSDTAELAPRKVF